MDSNCAGVSEKHPVKHKTSLVGVIALYLCAFDLKSADQRPDKAFWPREVKISEDIKVEQKTKNGVATSKRSHGSTVKVVSLDSDSLKIESDGFLGTISVEKTDFWERAENTRNAAIERQNREQALARESIRKGARKK